MLEKYRSKRNFSETPEPGPEVPKSGGDALTFVIQKHDATRLHYDFRIELDGVLVSWAVPKGPSLNPHDRRLAVRVEDHPLAYATFEGTIPKGNYGAGEVIVWDEGTYEPEEPVSTRKGTEDQIREELEKGHLKIRLHGHKLHGLWTIVRMDDTKNWLLIKYEDEAASQTEDILSQAQSVLSARKLKGVANLSPEAKRAPAVSMPASFVPMLATERHDAFDGAGWVFEAKLDGVRAIGVLNGDSATVFSRSGRDISKQFPEVVESLKALPYDTIAIDGEIVAMDAEGRPSFQVLMDRFHLNDPHMIAERRRRTPGTYYIFDVLFLEGHDLRKLPLSERIKVLDGLSIGGSIRGVSRVEKEGKLMYQHALELGFEGMMAKKLDSTYVSGVRSPSWVKVKSTTTGEFVVVGYTKGSGARGTNFGSLVLARTTDDGFVYAGNVGGGFDEAGLKSLTKQVEALKTDKSVFKEIPVIPGGKPTWVEPKLVVEVKYASLTREGRLRFPIFLRMRPDYEVGTPAVPTDVRQDIDETQRLIDELSAGEKDLRLKTSLGDVQTSNLDKILWPGDANHEPTTKRDYLIYLCKMSPYLLPHLADRPITLTRYPEGASGEWFFQKHLPPSTPDYIKRFDVYSKSKSESKELILCSNLTTLLWFGQMGSLEIHPWYSRIKREPDALELGTEFSATLEDLEKSVLNYPDFMVVDLDPYKYAGTEKPGEEPAYNRSAFEDACEVALKVRETLNGLGLVPFIKLSGKTGLHLFVPIERKFDYREVRVMAETIGQFVWKQMPKKVTLEWSVPKRVGKVFFDFNQNSRGKTLASIYSPRPTAAASVSFPVDWDQLATSDPELYTIRTAPDIVARDGDLWAGILGEKRALPL